MSDRDDTSLSASITRQSRALLRFLTRKVGAREAPDLAQEAILRVLRFAERTTVSEPAALLHLTASSLVKDFSRRRRVESTILNFDCAPDELASPTPGPDARLEAEEFMNRLQAAIDSLPPRSREVFMLRRFENLHQEEIARRLGVSRNMVEKHMRVAVKRLQEVLD